MRVPEIGILLGVSVFTFLPWFLLAVLVASVSMALAGVAAWAIWTLAQSGQDLAMAFFGGGLFLIWLHYETKSRCKMETEVVSLYSNLKPLPERFAQEESVVIPFSKSRVRGGERRIGF